MDTASAERGTDTACNPSPPSHPECANRQWESTTPTHTAPVQGGDSQGGGWVEGDSCLNMELVWVGTFLIPSWGDEGPWGRAAARGVAGSST